MCWSCSRSRSTRRFSPPLLAERLCLDRAQVARAGPCGQRRGYAAQQTADFPNSFAALDESLQQMTDSGAELVETRPHHHHGPKLKGQLLTSIFRDSF